MAETVDYNISQYFGAVQSAASVVVPQTCSMTPKPRQHQLVPSLNTENLSTTKDDLQYVSSIKGEDVEETDVTDYSTETAKTERVLTNIHFDQENTM